MKKTTIHKIVLCVFVLLVVLGAWFYLWNSNHNPEAEKLYKKAEQLLAQGKTAEASEVLGDAAHKYTFIEGEQPDTPIKEPEKYIQLRKKINRSLVPEFFSLALNASREDKIFDADEHLVNLSILKAGLPEGYQDLRDTVDKELAEHFAIQARNELKAGEALKAQANYLLAVSYGKGRLLKFKELSIDINRELMGRYYSLAEELLKNKLFRDAFAALNNAMEAARKSNQTVPEGFQLLRSKILKADAKRIEAERNYNLAKRKLSSGEVIRASLFLKLSEFNIDYSNLKPNIYSLRSDINKALKDM